MPKIAWSNRGHHIHVDYAGRTTPWMGEVELRREQQSRAPTVGALGDAGAIAEATAFALPGISAELWDVGHKQHVRPTRLPLY